MGGWVAGWLAGWLAVWLGLHAAGETRSAAAKLRPPPCAIVVVLRSGMGGAPR